jgi:hypothetical protein
MNIFNLSFFRKLMALLTFATPIIAKAVGCTLDAAGAAVCVDSWLSPQYVPWVMAFFAGAAFLSSFFGSGTIAQNVFAPSVPIVSVTESGPGTVTRSQVNSR